MITSKQSANRVRGFLAPFFMLFFLCGMVTQTPGQSREELERNKRALELEIREINQMLQETKKTADVSLNHLVMLNNQINRREMLIRTVNNEIRLIDTRIRNINQQIESLTKELEALREAYARMIRQAYRNRDATRGIMFILSARSFNQALLRMRYMQQYARHRQLQAQKIAETSGELTQRRAELLTERTEQQSLLLQQRQEVRTLAGEKESQNKVVAELRKQERDLMRRLQEREKAARELERSIERVIAEERRQAQERARAEGRSTTDMFALTPEERILSDNFAENQGKLLWPVERGVITSSFGEQPHPVLRGIKINNNGVDIATNEGSRARAIFDGVVSRVISVPGGNYAVIIRHGEYLTVYSNLQEVFVRNGQGVTMRQELGVVATETREAKTQMNLQIWKGNDKLNPERWIARQR